MRRDQVCLQRFAIFAAQKSIQRSSDIAGSVCSLANAKTDEAEKVRFSHYQSDKKLLKA